MSHDQHPDRRQPAEHAYAANAQIESALLASLPSDAPGIAATLLREALRARRQNRAISILLFQRRVEDEVKPCAPDKRRLQGKKLLSFLGASIRDTDACGALGDDEVLIILPGTDTERCALAATRLLTMVTPKYVRAWGMAMHWGAAELGDEDADISALITRARAALTPTLESTDA